MTVQTYLLPQSLDEAVKLLADDASMLVMSGGTITMPLINDGISAPEKVMGLRQTGLDYMQRVNGSLNIGATATLTQMLGQTDIAMLSEAAHKTGSWTIRNMGTVGGNLFVPPPAGDLATALLALDAEVRLVSAAGERTVPLADFYTGFLTTVLEPGELLAEIIVPVPTGQTAFIKYGRKLSNTPAIVTVAVHLVWDGDVISSARIALGAVGPHPIRAKGAEAVLEASALNETAIEAAATAAAAESEPFTDAIASEWYRRRMVKVHVGRTLKQLAGEEV